MKDGLSLLKGFFTNFTLDLNYFKVVLRPKEQFFLFFGFQNYVN